MPFNLRRGARKDLYPLLSESRQGSSPLAVVNLSYPRRSGKGFVAGILLVLGGGFIFLFVLQAYNSDETRNSQMAGARPADERLFLNTSQEYSSKFLAKTRALAMAPMRAQR